MYDKEVCYYNVIVFKKTILKQFHKEKIETFNDI